MDERHGARANPAHRRRARCPLNRTADLAVIGAGMAGLATALHAARAGKRVVVLERDEPCAAASGVNAGTLGLQNKRPPLLPFYGHALEEWERLARELGEHGRVRPGGWHVAAEEHVALLRETAQAHEGAGFAVEWVEGAALRTRAPWLGPKVAAATRSAADAYANPQRADAALLTLVRRAGAEVLSHTSVTAARRGGAGYVLTTPAGDIETAAVAIAAGPWSARVAALFGHRLPVRPSLIALSVTAPAPPVMDALVTHVTGRLTMKQFAHGAVLIGGGWPGRGQLDPYAPGVDSLVIQHNLAFAADVVPALGRLTLLRTWGGFEAESADGLPLLGRLSDDPPLVLCLPTAAGWTAGPLMGRLAAALVSGEALPEWARPMAYPRT